MPWAVTQPEGNLASFGNIALHGGDVGGLAAALAHLRYQQIKDAQDQAVNAGLYMKKLQDQAEADRAAAASIQSGQSAGLIPQGDYGTGPESAKYAMSLASQLETKRQRDLQATIEAAHAPYWKAQGDQAAAMAEWIRAGKPLSGPDSGSATGPNTYVDPTTGLTMVGRTSARGVTNYFPLATGLQPTTARTSAPPAQENIDAIIKGYGLTRSDFLDSTRQRGFVNGQPLPAGQPWTNATHIQIAPGDATKPTPSIPIDVFNSIKSQIVGADKNLAPGYGSTTAPKIADTRPIFQDANGNKAYKNPDGTFEPITQ